MIADAAEYYTVALVHLGALRRRGPRRRKGGRQLIDPVGEAESTIGRVAALVAATADDEPVLPSPGR